ncbi:AbgT family transporter [Carboxylicivirga sediminis]|uniref:AbgT family transporter n=1 Tax=Carboxylicivirga sediminis TaxID=2006564 RepID=A0A941F6N5_9BACT|nr:AbgT family transporter [Carboxylicivirga sediminis]MBR8537756.1 AbgT family transporter [Carboxylicivirga sediminis]
MGTAVKKKKSLVDLFLNGVERVGNILPHPALLFGIFAVVVLILSGLFAWMGATAAHPTTGKAIHVINLLSVEGLNRILTEMVKNFTSFAPMGIVVVAMLGIGLAEKSDLIGALIRKLVLAAPKGLLTFVIILAGVISNVASSVGYVLLVPLGGVIFLVAKRHPLVGMAAAFAGVSGGFSANLIIGTIDPLLAGLTEEAAHIVDKTYTVNPVSNYYFMVVSTFMVALVGTWVTEKIIAPRFGEYTGEVSEEETKLEKLSAVERKGLLWVGLVSLAFIGIILWGLLPEGGFLRGADGHLLTSPLLKGVVAVLFVWAGTCGVVYGKITGKFKSDKDIMGAMGEAAKSLGPYLVLVFFAAQFVAYFNWSNLGLVMAVNGANLIQSLNLSVIPLMLLFALFCGLINLVMGSASAKWALLAPIFVPMFMMLGYSPELTQVVYRIGDSATNIISPMMSFFALIIVYFQKYDEKAGIGTIVSTMLPYSMVFLFSWMILLALWLLSGLPLGPTGVLHYSM